MKGGGGTLRIVLIDNEPNEWSIYFFVFCLPINLTPLFLTKYKLYNYLVLFYYIYKIMRFKNIIWFIDSLVRMIW